MVAFDTAIRGLAVLIEFGGGLLVVFGCLRALGMLMSGLGSRTSVVAARLVVADGIVAALGFKTAATLLKTIELRGWDAIAMFVAVFALRTLVKRSLIHEEARLKASRHRHDSG